MSYIAKSRLSFLLDPKAAKKRNPDSILLFEHQEILVFGEQGMWPACQTRLLLELEFCIVFGRLLRAGELEGTLHQEKTDILPF
jgi:hypothetical protein